MTTKSKIIAGFLCMILLVGVTGVIGYRSSDRFSVNLAEYERLADFNVAMSDLQNAVNRASLDLYMYVDTMDPKHLAASKKSGAEALVQLGNAMTEVRLETRRSVLVQLTTEVQGFSGVLDQVGASASRAAALYAGSEETSRAIVVSLKTLSQHAGDVNAVPALMILADVWDHFAAARAYLGEYAQSRNPDHAGKAGDNLAAIEQSFTALESELDTMQMIETAQALQGQFGLLRKALTELTEAGGEVARLMGGLNDQLARQLTMIFDLNAGVDAQMRAYGTEMSGDAAQTRSSMLFITVAGFLVGLGIAGFIISGLIRVLRELSAYALEISKGNFGHTARVRERGEIGAMLGAMNTIPEVLKTVVGEAGRLAGRIQGGGFRSRIDASGFSGGFKDLTSAVNTVSDAYTAVLDIIPLPIMACAPDMHIVYLNQAAGDVMGDKAVGESCASRLKSPVCGTAGCCGRTAISGNKLYDCETPAEPHNGDHMDLKLTGVPMRDASGKPVAFIELMTDLTAIKRQQTTILRVAAEASAMSDRVAAASEELSAQVEQVSHGAEIQRSRVESTASAITEMNATVLEVAQNAGRASDQTDETREKAEDGANLVGQVVQAINTVNRVTTAMQANMHELGRQADSIGGVMNVISDIADQTNLLALNAAIEAARAGDAGRGFAVVADEVRKLAEKTMTATQEVGQSITAMQQSARTNIGSMDEAARNVTEATNLAGASGAALQEIVELASVNSSIVTSIATAAEEQSATSEEINRALEEVSQVVAETSQGMMQASDAVRDLARTAQELRTTMEALH